MIHAAFWLYSSQNLVCSPQFDQWLACFYNKGMSGLSYENSGVNYDVLDAFKRLPEAAASTTAPWLHTSASPRPLW